MKTLVPIFTRGFFLPVLLVGFLLGFFYLNADAHHEVWIKWSHVHLEQGDDGKYWSPLGPYSSKRDCINAAFDAIVADRERIQRDLGPEYVVRSILASLSFGTIRIEVRYRHVLTFTVFEHCSITEPTEDMVEEMRKDYK